MGSVDTPVPALRWGILGTGWISTMFVKDLLASKSGSANHTLAALGSSSLVKGNAFVEKLWESAPEQPKPAVYADYHGVYNDESVDIVYIGTPHSLHKMNCLDAISAGKHVLCEKPFTINAKEAQEVIDAARKKNVFIMEAVWTRFSPLFDALRSEIVDKASIGQVERFFMDFGNYMPLDDLPASSRLKDPTLGAGALLDIGIYTLTYASFIMGDFKVGDAHPKPSRVLSSLSISHGIDESNVIVLEYPATSSSIKYHAKTAILSSTFRYRTSEDFARIEGSSGTITIFGPAGSLPGGFRTVAGPRPGFGEADTRKVRTYTVERPEGTLGFFWEADAVAHDIANGRTENAVMPLDESLRIMKLMDEIRKEGGLVYPQDRE
ncbi:NAD(P)-binding protein [Cadophora sp. DSE1049]|nr:NAD(P)-binding protein [Cadophora sp. DSE1049]